MGLVAAIPWVEGFGSLQGAERDDALMTLMREHRRVTAELAAAIGLVDASASYADDGHACTRAWFQAVTNSSRGDAQVWVSTARTLRDMPAAAEAFADGVLGESQLGELVRLRGNPRCRSQLAESDDLLVEHGQRLWFDDFRTVCARWKMLADPDGNHRDHERAHDARRVSADVVGTEFVLRASGGSVDGAEVIEILDAFAEAEFQADWAEIVASHGEHPPASLMARSATQRRYDALMRIFAMAASATGLGATASGSVVNFVIDPATFEDEVRRAAGLPGDPPDPSTVMSRRCETTTGIPVDPQQVLAAALIGRARRIIVDSAGIIIDAGRVRRFYTGALRDVIQANQQRCTWPGCQLAAGCSHVDHATPFHDEGTTSTANANIDCGRHNRLKEHGFRVWRNPNGQWHTYRPDGTEIAPRATPNLSPRPRHSPD